jgi:hypothetical protein
MFKFTKFFKLFNFKILSNVPDLKKLRIITSLKYFLGGLQGFSNIFKTPFYAFSKVPKLFTFSKNLISHTQRQLDRQQDDLIRLLVFIFFK